MREEPKLFGSGSAGQGGRGEERLSIMGIEPEDEFVEDPGDYEDEVSEERPRRRLLLIVLGAVAAIVIGGVAAGLFMGVGDSPTPVRDVVLITADPTPFKHRPDDPGGLEVPYQDVEVFGTLGEDEAGADESYEVLLPEPEEPLETMPEEVIVETTEEGLPVVDLDYTTATDDVVVEDGAIAPDATGTAVPPLPATPPQRVADTNATGATTTEPTTPEAVTDNLSFDDVAASVSGGEGTQPQSVAPAAGGSKVQIAAFGSEGNALDAWAFLKGSHPDLLSDYQPIIDTATLETGTFYRLQIGPFGSEAEAKGLCDNLRSRQVDCLVVNP